MFEPIRRPLVLCAGIALAFAVFSATPGTAQEEAVVATVNGTPITESDLQRAEGELDPRFARLSQDKRRAAALSAMIEIRLLADKAEEEGLDKTEEFGKRMEFLRERALHSAFIEQDVAGTITDKQVRARYDKRIADTPPANEIRARHILVDTKKEAEEIIGALDAGGDFAEIAKEKSKDGSAEKGGDLGYFAPGQMVGPFEKAAFGLDVGEYTEKPVKTRFGWHVIKVEDKRAQQPPSFEEVKDRIRAAMIREKYLAEVARIRAAASVDVTDETLRNTLESLENRAGAHKPSGTGDAE